MNDDEGKNWEIVSLVEFLFMKKRKSERIIELGMTKLVRITNNGFAPTGRRSPRWETTVIVIRALVSVMARQKKNTFLNILLLISLSKLLYKFCEKTSHFFCYDVLPWQICSRTRPLISLKAEKLTANTCSLTGSEAISLSSSLS